MRLKRGFFLRPAYKVAPDLLGKVLVRKYKGCTLSGIITETEAYHGLQDKASHASRGRTPRNSIMFDQGGYTYIYLIYGMYYCFNVTTDKKDIPSAVLIRAIYPLEGIDKMKKLRKIKDKNIHHLSDGPGKLCQALQIDKSLDRIDITKSDKIYITDGGVKVGKKDIHKSPRIGVDYAGEWKNKLWRFYIDEDYLRNKVYV